MLCALLFSYFAECKKLSLDFSHWFTDVEWMTRVDFPFSDPRVERGMSLLLDPFLILCSKNTGQIF